MVDTRGYCAYILRGWSETADDEARAVWRFRLRDVQTGEERAFASLEAVMAYLEQAFEEDEASAP